MKRNMDIIREVLLKLEGMSLDGNVDSVYPDSLGIEGRSYDEIAYHLVILIDGDLVDGERDQSGGFALRKLTWAGHDFLDSVRDPKIWHATKERVKDAGGFTIDVLAGVAKEIITHNLGRIAGAALGI